MRLELYHGGLSNIGKTFAVFVAFIYRRRFSIEPILPHFAQPIRDSRVPRRKQPIIIRFCVITRRTSPSPTSCRSPIIIHTVLRYPPKSWQNRTRAISPGFGSTGSKTPACSNRRGRRYATCAHDEKTRTHNQQRGGLSRAFSGTLQRRNIHSATGDRRYVQRYIAQDSGV